MRPVLPGAKLTSMGINPKMEAVMTELRDLRRDVPTRAAASPDPEVKPEVISDLAVTGDDPDDIVGGNCRLSKEC
jgi:hypothetical protein